MNNRWLAFPFSYSFSASTGGFPVNLLAQFLTFLPPDAKLAWAYDDRARGLYTLVFSSNNFSEVPVGARIPEGMITCIRDTSGDKVISVSYPNGLPLSAVPTAQTHILNGSLATACNHDWEIYHGLMDTSEVCKRCGVERK